MKAKIVRMLALVGLCAAVAPPAWAQFVSLGDSHKFIISATEVARFTSSTRLGIGTQSPSTALEVMGTISATQVSATNIYAKSVSGSTGTFEIIGAGAIAASGNVTSMPLVSTSSGGILSGTYLYGNVASFTTLTVGGQAVTGGSNADTVDGYHASSFALLSGATFSGNVTAANFYGNGSNLTGISSTPAGSWCGAYVDPYINVPCNGSSIASTCPSGFTRRSFPLATACYGDPFYCNILILYFCTKN